MDDRVTRSRGQTTVRVFESPEQFRRASVSIILDHLSSGCAGGGRCSLVLSGGTTPRPVYERLAEEAAALPLPWAQVHLFWGDERCVPPDSPESNFRMARESLLSRIHIPDRNVHRMRGESPPEVAAAAYAAELKRHFGTMPPPFDVVLLGLGADGHTASLFPESPVLHEENSWVTTAMHDDRWRITFTPNTLNAAKEILFMVTGEDKAEAVAATLEGAFAPLRFPAQGVRPRRGTVSWHLDAAAASRLRNA